MSCQRVLQILLTKQAVIRGIAAKSQTQRHCGPLHNMLTHGRMIVQKRMLKH